MNTLAIADAHLNSISTLLQKSFNAICAIKNASPDQKAILQKIIDSNKQQIVHIINSASFDGKKLLQGDISNLQISNNPISIKNISEGKLFRTSFAQAINNWLAADHTRCRYYQNQAEIQLDLAKNNSLIYSSLKRNGSGTGQVISIQETCNAIIGARNTNPNIISLMESTLPESLASLKAIAPADARRSFLTANHLELVTATSRIPDPNPGMKREFIPLLYNNPNGGCKSLTQVGYLFYTLQNFRRAIKFQTTSWSII